MAVDTKVETIEDAYKAAKRTSRSNRNRVQELSDNSLVGPVDRQTVAQTQSQLEALDALLTRMLAYSTRIQSYIREQERNDTFDFAAEYTPIRNTARTLAAWIGSAFPADMPIIVYDDSQPNNMRRLTFASSQMSQFRTNAALFVVTVVNN